MLVTKKCNRSCDGCCNKDWDLDSLPICESFSGYDQIMITGGEPTLDPYKLYLLARDIRDANPRAQLILYTANPIAVNLFINFFDAITLTLHDKSDVDEFLKTNIMLCDLYVGGMLSCNLRLNTFVKNIPYDKNHYHGIWDVRYMQWIKDCPLPKDEVFMRLKNLY